MSTPQGAYQDFLTLWKDADPDIPILEEAKAEYAKLQRKSALAMLPGLIAEDSLGSWSRWPAAVRMALFLQCVHN
jgi:hypothetical protein